MPEGKNVNLRVVEKEDLPLLTEWVNNLEVLGEYVPLRQDRRTETNLAAMAAGADIEKACTASTLVEFKSALEKALHDFGLIIVKIEKGTVPSEKPSLSGVENKYKLVRYIVKTEGIEIIKREEQPSSNNVDEPSSCGKSHIRS